MSWWWVYVIIAAVFVAMLVAYAVWLWHKATDVYAELKVLGRRGEQLADVLARLDLRPLERGQTAAGRPENLIREPHDTPSGGWDPYDGLDDEWTAAPRRAPRGPRD